MSANESELLLDQNVAPALHKLRVEHDVGVLGAWAVGARARGTAHEESDVDAFAVCINEPSTLVTQSDSMYREFGVFDYDTGVDVQAWSLGAVFDGIMDDDPTTIHALCSDQNVFHGFIPATWWDLEEYVLENLNTFQLLNHYRSLAKNNFRKYIEKGNDPTVNRLFFITDALIRALYIEENGALPPYDAPTLATETGDMGADSGSYLADNDFLDYRAMIRKKQGGRGDQSLLVEWDDDDLITIEKELSREPRGYDRDHYGEGVDGTIVDSMIQSIASRFWSAQEKGVF